MTNCGSAWGRILTVGNPNGPCRSDEGSTALQGPAWASSPSSLGGPLGSLSEPSVFSPQQHGGGDTDLERFPLSIRDP